MKKYHYKKSRNTSKNIFFLFVGVIKLVGMLVKLPFVILSYLLPRKWLGWIHKGNQTHINISLGLLFLIIVPVVYLVWQNTQKAEAAWFDDTWKYRQAITITVASSSSNITNLQTLISVDTSTLITNSKLRSQCEDLRFTNQNGDLLPYYLASACNTSTTKIWVLVDLVPKNTTTYTMYMYYGNAYVSSGSDATQFSLVKGLVGYWPMNESSWTGDCSTATVTDLSGNTNTGTACPNGSAAAITASGKYANGGSFNGSTQYLDMGNPATLQLTTNFTLSAWINPTSLASTKHIIGKDINASRGFTFYAQNNNKLGFEVNGVATCEAGTLSTSTWQMVSVTYNGSVAQLYVNGAAVGSTCSYASVPNSTSNLNIGRRAYSGFEGYFPGTIDDARAYNRVLTSTELAQLYASSDSILTTSPSTSLPTTSFASEEKSPSPVAYWKFDEGFGNLTNNAIGTADTTTGLVSYWNFDANTSWTNDCSTGTVTDMVSSNNLKSCPNTTGVTTPATGKYTNAVDLNGSSQYLETPTSPGIPTGDFTYSAWVNLDATNDEMLVMASDTTGANEFFIHINTNKVQVLTNGVVAVQSNASISTSTWTHIAATRRGSTVAVYINGVLDNTGTDGVAMSFSTCQLLIGTDADATCNTSLANYLDGKIDDLRVYNRPLTSQQIASLYNNGPEGTLTGTTKPTWQTEDQCISGKCLSFNGSTALVQVANVNGSNTSPLRQSSAFTYSFWFNFPTGSSGGYAMGTGASGGHGYGGVQITTSSVIFRWTPLVGGVASDTSLTASYTFTPNTWYHVEIAMDLTGTNCTTTKNISINGVSQTATINNSVSSCVPQTSYNNNLNDYIGGRYVNSQLYFDGKLDDVKIYNYVRTQAQIQTDYTGKGAAKGTGTSFGANNQNLNALNSGLAGYWKMNETSWATNCSNASIIDSSGNSNNARACPNASATAIAGGKFGNAASFDGTNDYIEASDSASLDVTLLTVAAWINPTGLGGTLVQKSTAVGTNGYSLDTQGSKLRFCAGNGCMSSNTTLSTSSWQHAAVTYDGTNVRFYLNGVEDGIRANNPVSTNALVLRMGADSSGATLFSGKMDEVRIYNRPLNGDEMTQLYNFAPGPIGYWNLEEGSGTTANDTSGNASTGTLTNGPTWATGRYGKAVTFDGANDYIQATNPLPLDTTYVGFTASAWVKRSSIGTTDYIMGKMGVAGIRGWQIYFWTDNKLYMDYFDGPAGSSDSVGTSETYGNTIAWMHVAVTFTASQQAIIYINGVEVARDATTLTQLNGNNSSNFRIADRGDGDGYFAGTIDEVRIYNYTRTAKQIVEDMNGGHPTGGSPVGSPLAYYKFDEGYGRLSRNSINTADYTTGLVGYWNMDESSWTGDCSTATVTDITGNGNTGKACPNASAPQTANAKYVKGGNFDGTNDYVQVTTSSSISPTSQITVSGWFRATTLTNITGSYVSKRNSYILHPNSDGSMNFYIYNTVTGFANPAASSVANGITLNTWQFWTGTFDGTTTRLYRNGVLVASKVDPGTMGTSGDLYIGGDIGCACGTRQFTGTADDIRIYNRALTAEQIASMYTNGPEATTNNMASPANSSSGWTQNGKFGKGLNLDGTDDYLDVASNSAIVAPTTQLTMSAWVKTNKTTGTQEIFSTGAGPGWAYCNNYGQPYEMRLSNNTTKPEFNMWVSGPGYQSVTANTSLTQGTWNYVAATYNSGTVKIYINGKLDKTGTTTSTSIAYPLWGYTPTIGANKGGNGSSCITDSYFSGTIDEFKLYAGALTDSEIKIDYNHGAALVLGALSTDSTNPNGITASNSASAEYCVPGDTTTCTPPIGEWKFEEGSGTAAQDTSGNANTGTLTNSPTWASGKLGKGLLFNGSNNYVTMGSPSTFDIATGTISLWFTMSSTSTDRKWIFSKDQSGFNVDDIGLFIEASSDATYPNRIRGYVSDATQNYFIASNTAVTLNTWTHVVLEFGTGGLKMYVNGILQSETSAQTFGMTNTTPDFNIGYLRTDVATSYFPGRIDNVRAYNYSRTPAQIAWEYNQGSPVAWWKIDECQGTTIGESMGSTMSGTLTIGGSGTQTSAGTCTTSGTTAWYQGRVGKRNYSLNFDGTDDYVTTVHSTALNPGPGNLTVSMWVKWTANRGGVVKNTGDTSCDACENNNGYGLIVNNDGRPEFIVGSGGGNFREYIGTGKALAVGTWYHLTGIWDAANQRASLYINGVFAGANNATGGTVSSVDKNYDVKIGCLSSNHCENGNIIDGQIDDVRIYNYALTTAQIRTLYNNGAVTFGPVLGAP